MSDNRENEKAPTEDVEETTDDLAEKPGTSSASKEQVDGLVDEWEDESFPASDPPAHY